MKPNEISDALKGAYWLSTFPAKLLQYLVAFLGILLLFPVQLVTWFRSPYGFSETLPYHFFMVLVAAGDDVSDRSQATLPRGYRSFLEDFELMHSWYLNHAQFVRIFLLGRDSDRHDDGTVTVHPHPTPDRAVRLRRFALGTMLVVLSLAPVAGLGVLAWLKVSSG